MQLLLQPSQSRKLRNYAIVKGHTPKSYKQTHLWEALKECEDFPEDTTPTSLPPNASLKKKKLAVMSDFCKSLTDKKWTVKKRVTKKKVKVGYYRDYAKVSVEFFSSRAWKELRYKVLVKYGGACMLCGNRPPDCTIHVDHIKSRYKYPELELEFSNMQILCHLCNIGKGYKHEDDFRPKELDTP